MALPQVTMECRVVEDPTLKFAPSGVAVCSLRVVASQRKKVEDKWVDDKTCWLDVACFREMAEHVAESCKKGTVLIVVGKLETQSWTNDDGAKRSKVALIADEVSMSMRWAPVTTGARAERTSTPSDDAWAAPAADDPPF